MVSSKSREVETGFSHEKIQEGQHIIYVYNDDNERKRTIAKFLQQGLITNEKVLYLVDDISPGEMKKELMDLGVDVDQKQDDFDITEGHHKHCPDNFFSRDFMLEVVGDYYDNAIKEGYSGARGAGEMSWAVTEGRANIAELLDYEASLNEILKVHPLTTVCQYDARKFNGELIMDVLSLHPMMIVRGQIFKNPSFMKREDFFKEYSKRMVENHS